MPAPIAADQITKAVPSSARVVRESVSTKAWRLLGRWALAAIFVVGSSSFYWIKPPGTPIRPRNNSVGLSDPAVGLNDVTKIMVKVHYRFPDNPPISDDWFAFDFDVNGGRSGSFQVCKRGRDLAENGVVEATATVNFLKRSKVSVEAKVRQTHTKNGPWMAVSDRLVVDF